MKFKKPTEMNKMNESDGRMNFGRFTYYWSLSPNVAFEMTKQLNDELQSLMLNYSTAFYTEKLTDFLSKVFNTKMEIRTCKIGTKDFSLALTGKGVFFGITIHF